MCWFCICALCAPLKDPRLEETSLGLTEGFCGPSVTIFTMGAGNLTSAPAPSVVSRRIFSGENFSARLPSEGM
jgi:hypothetical protein